MKRRVAFGEIRRGDFRSTIWEIVDGEQWMRKKVREHIAKGGDPFTPPDGISRTDLDWLGHGLNEATRISKERL